MFPLTSKIQNRNPSPYEFFGKVVLIFCLDDQANMVVKYFDFCNFDFNPYVDLLSFLTLRLQYKLHKSLKGKIYVITILLFNELFWSLGKPWRIPR